MKDELKKYTEMLKKSLGYLRVKDHYKDEHANKNKYLLALFSLVVILNLYKYSNKNVLAPVEELELSSHPVSIEEDTELSYLKKDQIYGKRVGIAKSKTRIYSTQNKLFLNERTHDSNGEVEYVYDVFLRNISSENQRLFNDGKENNGLVRYRR